MFGVRHWLCGKYSLCSGTVSAILFGLLPIMWSPATQAGADVMKGIATPMIRGVITSAILELLIYPVIFVLWR